MAKIKAPLFSLDATGTLDKNITYKKKLHDNIAQKYSQPGAKNPFESSPRQKDQRSIIRLITIHWQCMSSADKLSWENAAKDVRFKGTGYHYFLHMAQQNLTQYLGLVGYWSMNYNVDDKIPDLSGNGNHAILKPIFPCDCPFLVDSFDKKHGKALYFDGVDDWLKLVERPFLSLGTSDVTIELILKLKRSPLPIEFLIGNHHPGSYTPGFCLMKETTGFLRFRVGVVTGEPKVTMFTKLLINTFYHLVITRVGSVGKIYLNGEDDTSASGDISGTFDSTVLDINISYPQVLNGLIDDVRIYKVALSPLEIKKHYQSYNL